MEEITRTRHKRLDGEALTQDERRFLTTYYNRYAPCKLTLQVKTSTREAWTNAARAQGMSPCGWVEHRVSLSLMPVSPEVEAAKRDAQEAHDELVVKKTWRRAGFILAASSSSWLTKPTGRWVPMPTSPLSRPTGSIRPADESLRSPRHREVKRSGSTRCCETSANRP